MRSKGTLETRSYRLEDDALGSHSASSIARDRFWSLENPKREGPRGRVCKRQYSRSKFEISDRYSLATTKHNSRAAPVGRQIHHGDLDSIEEKSAGFPPRYIHKCHSSSPPSPHPSPSPPLHLLPSDILQTYTTSSPCPFLTLAPQTHQARSIRSRENRENPH